MYGVQHCDDDTAQRILARPITAAEMAQYSVVAYSHMYRRTVGRDSVGRLGTGGSRPDLPVRCDTNWQAGSRQ